MQMTALSRSESGEVDLYLAAQTSQSDSIDDHTQADLWVDAKRSSGARPAGFTKAALERLLLRRLDKDDSDGTVR